MRLVGLSVVPNTHHSEFFEQLDKLLKLEILDERGTHNLTSTMYEDTVIYDYSVVNEQIVKLDDFVLGDALFNYVDAVVARLTGSSIQYAEDSYNFLEG